MTLTQQIPERARNERLAVIRGDLMRRIKPVCGGMPDDLFIELIESMAVVQLKYESLDAPAITVSL